MTRILFIFSLVLLIGLKSFAQPGKTAFEKAEAEIETIMQKMEVVGLSVAVVKNNKLYYTKAFGYRNIETKTPLASNHLFRIASISKSFSATATMKLVEKGKLSLDDDFGKLIGFPIRNPKYPDRVITLKMVLSHTSGINDSEGYFNLDVINPAKNNNWAKCYNDYAPGEGYQYCNLNFNMLGAVLEKTTGVRFDNFIRQQIITPLGLNAGYCVDSLNEELFATLYELDSATKTFKASTAAYAPRRQEITNYVMGYTTPIFSPTGGMKISALDLAEYMLMHMNYGKNKTRKGRRIISKKSARIMQTAVSPEEGYGLALWNTDKLIKGIPLVGHTGSAYGLYSAMFFHPKKKFGFVVITNGCNPVYSDGTNEVLRSTINALYEIFVK